MGSECKKIKFKDVGNYGSTEEKYLYVQYNRGCDVTSYFDENGSCILSFDDSLEGNIVDKICESHANWDGENMERATELELKEAQRRHEERVYYSPIGARDFYNKMTEEDKRKFLEMIDK